MKLLLDENLSRRLATNRRASGGCRSCRNCRNCRNCRKGPGRGISARLSQVSRASTRPWLRVETTKTNGRPAIRRYWADCKRLLSQPLADDCDTLPVIELDALATDRMAAFFETMEREGRQGALRDVQPFALRATEQACRIAGVLACFSGADVIDDQTAASGAALAAHSLDNWQAALSGKADPVVTWALTLYRWLVDRVGWVALKDIPRIGPSSLRTADRRNDAIDRLEAVGLLEFDGGNVKAGGVDYARH